VGFRHIRHQGILAMTADERLAIVRLKIERANKHIGDLQTAVRTFVNSNPYKVTSVATRSG
jgi:hypothetical protein